MHSLIVAVVHTVTYGSADGCSRPEIIKGVLLKSKRAFLNLKLDRERAALGECNPFCYQGAKKHIHTHTCTYMHIHAHILSYIQIQHDICMIQAYRYKFSTVFVCICMYLHYIWMYLYVLNVLHV